MVQKKLQKKLAQSLEFLQRKMNIAESDVSTKILFVAKGGLICGWTYDSLHQLFSAFGSVANVLLYSDMPFAFVQFETTMESQRALEAVNSGEYVSCNPQVKQSIYCAFVDKVPAGLQNVGIPPGLHILEDFIDEDEEARLLAIFRRPSSPPADADKTERESLADEEAPLVTAENVLKRRHTYHFGYRFIYGSNAVDLENRPLPIPEHCSALIDRIVATGCLRCRPDQLTVNVYEPGQGIPFHTDTHSAFEDAIVSLSLSSGVQMEFRHPTKSEQRSVFLPPRSLCVMTGEARYVWTHGIASRKYDTLQDGRIVPRQFRVSFTFRCVRRIPCQCDYPLHCDHARENCSAQADAVARFDCNVKRCPENDIDAMRLESECVHNVYDEIAKHFDKTRHSCWPGVLAFLSALPDDALVLDVGCGNGKYLSAGVPWNRSILFKLGCDRSLELCQICAEKDCDVFCCDGIALPLASCRFDAAISIAVIHHFATEARRLQAISQLLSAVRPGGKVLIYVWAFEQKRDDVSSRYLKSSEEEVDLPPGEKKSASVGTAGKQLVVHKNRTQFQATDLLVPWELSGQHKRNGCQGAETEEKQKPSESSGASKGTFYRYYHVFTAGELTTLCGRLDNCKIVNEYYEQGNWCIVLEKI